MKLFNTSTDYTSCTIFFVDGGGAECCVCADTAARPPIDASGFNIYDYHERPIQQLDAEKEGIQYSYFNSGFHFKIT